MNLQTLHQLYAERLPEIEEIIDMEPKEAKTSDRGGCLDFSRVFAGFRYDPPSVRWRP